MRREDRLRAERAAELRLRRQEAARLLGHVQRPDAGTLRAQQARTRDDRGGGQKHQSLLLLPDRERRRGAPADGRSEAWGAYGDEVAKDRERPDDDRRGGVYIGNAEWRERV